MQKLKKSESLLQLSMKDSTDPRKTFLYKLSLEPGLEFFRYILLCGSSQDHYVPIHSSHIELCTPSINDTSMIGIYWNTIKFNNRSIQCSFHPFPELYGHWTFFFAPDDVLSYSFLIIPFALITWPFLFTVFFLCSFLASLHQFILLFFSSSFSPETFSSHHYFLLNFLFCISDWL